MTAADIHPVHLKCEHRVDPLGIDERAPRLSWALASDGRAKVQSVYRVLVAGSEEDLEAEANLLWDSGRIESNRSLGIEYGGETLRSGARCVWNVRVWDGDGGTSSPSDPAVFEVGLLERLADWEGGWISAGEGTAGDIEPPTGD